MDLNALSRTGELFMLLIGIYILLFRGYGRQLLNANKFLSFVTRNAIVWL